MCHPCARSLYEHYLILWLQISRKKYTHCPHSADNKAENGSLTVEISGPMQ